VKEKSCMLILDYILTRKKTLIFFVFAKINRCHSFYLLERLQNSNALFYNAKSESYLVQYFTGMAEKHSLVWFYKKY